MLLFSTVLDINDTLTKDAFIKLVIDWNQGSPHKENVIPNIDWHNERNVRYGDDKMWLDIQEYRNGNTIAVRYEKVEDDGVIWDTDYVMNEMARGRGTQFDPDVLDAFMRLVQKGVINLDDLYARRRSEIQTADQKAEAERAHRAEEDKRIQAASMDTGKGDVPADKEGA